MSITPEAPAKTLTQLVATEIKVAMARRDVRQSQLAREIGKTEMWLSVRLRGRQPIDMNDLALIARALNVGVRELLPSDEDAASAADPRTTPEYAPMVIRTAAADGRPPDNRPNGRPGGAAARTAYVDRSGRHRGRG